MTGPPVHYPPGISMPDPAAAHDKPTLRRGIRAAIAATSPAQRAAWSESITRRLFQHPVLQSARGLHIYAPMPHASGQSLEVEFTPYIRALLNDRRAAVAIMTIDPRTPVVLSDWDADLVPGPPPVLREPRPGLPTLPLDQIDAVLVPGLAFSPTAPHQRLGRGRGDYDRFLAALPSRPDLPRGRAALIAPAFPVQIVPDIPTLPHDLPVDELILPD